MDIAVHRLCNPQIYIQALQRIGRGPDAQRPRLGQPRGEKSLILFQIRRHAPLEPGLEPFPGFLIPDHDASSVGVSTPKRMPCGSSGPFSSR
jgi:hypothetical protein